MSDEDGKVQLQKRSKILEDLTEYCDIAWMRTGIKTELYDLSAQENISGVIP
jgi:hypothetical protein